MAFRAQIPEANKTVLKAYGEIYLKAWKDASDDVSPQEENTRNALEHQILQDLMHAAIHVSSPVTARSLLTLLEPIHAEKKQPKVAELLYRLYSPILWRSLTAANPLVRRNAVGVLEQVFPLQDPSSQNSQTMKVAVQKGTAALKTALQDADPRVRVAGSEATARVCVTFWDALPAADIRMLLNRKFVIFRCHSFCIVSVHVFAHARIEWSIQKLSWNTLRIHRPQQYVPLPWKQPQLCSKHRSRMLCCVRSSLPWETSSMTRQNECDSPP
jgi:hypothetical protein